MKRVEILDYARLLAAGVVMCFHYFVNGIANGKLTSLPHIASITSWARYGYLGVEFFFIISGFVIAHSYHGKTSGQFAVSRAVRLLPAYWAAVVITTVVSWWIGEGGMIVTADRLAANILPIAKLLGRPYVDGVYWTLLYELVFYGLIFAFLVVGWRNRITTFFLLWPWLMLAAQLVGAGTLPLLGGYFVYFAAGAVFAGRETWPPLLRLPTLGVCLYLGMSVGVANGVNKALETGMAYDSGIVAGAIAAMFALFLALDWRPLRLLRLPGSHGAGALTYPLYLVHAHIGYMLLSRYGDPAHPIASTLIVIAIVVAIAAVLHVLVERLPAAHWRVGFAALLGGPIDRLIGRFDRSLARE